MAGELASVCKPADKLPAFITAAGPGEAGPGAGEKWVWRDDSP